MKRCHKCGLVAVKEVSTELSFVPGIAYEPVYTLGKMSICLECGFAECQVSKEPLAQLRQALRLNWEDLQATGDRNIENFT